MNQHAKPPLEDQIGAYRAILDSSMRQSAQRQPKDDLWTQDERPLAQSGRAEDGSSARNKRFLVACGLVALAALAGALAQGLRPGGETTVVLGEAGSTASTGQATTASTINESPLGSSGEPTPNDADDKGPIVDEIAGKDEGDTDMTNDTTTDDDERTTDTREVTVDIFSGRPNPTFSISADELNALEITVDRLAVSDNRAPNPTDLGFRGFRIESFSYKGQLMTMWATGDFVVLEIDDKSSSATTVTLLDSGSVFGTLLSAASDNLEPEVLILMS